MTERPSKLVASDGAKRMAQFITARTIFHPDETLIPGTDRPRYTTAGHIREPAYRTPFPLGPFTFMVTEGTNFVDAGGNFSAVVWIEMLGPVAEWHNTHHVDKTPTSDGVSTSIIINRKWLCIGILRRDNFIPMLPDFMELLRLQTHNEHRKDKHLSNYAHVGISHIHGTRVESGFSQFYAGSFLSDYNEEALKFQSLELASDYEDEDGNPLSDGEKERVWHDLVNDEDEWHLFEDIYLAWVQQIPDGEAEIDFIYREHGLDSVKDSGDLHNFLEQDHQEQLVGLEGNGKMQTSVNDQGANILVRGVVPVPLIHVASYLPFDIPEEFKRDLIPEWDENVDYFRAPCRYVVANGWSWLPKMTAWTLSDISSICYAHSLLMHVLTGPDRRRYDPTYPDNGSPMKETQEPRSLYIMKPYTQDEQGRSFNLQLRTGPGSQTSEEIISLSYSFRFYNESLAMRAAKVVHKQIMDQGVNPATGEFEQGRLVVAFTKDPTIPGILQVIKDRQERAELLEFIGCHVCADMSKPVTHTVTGTGGIRVCSRDCHERLKGACKQ